MLDDELCFRLLRVDRVFAVCRGRDLRGGEGRFAVAIFRVRREIHVEDQRLHSVRISLFLLHQV